MTRSELTKLVSTTVPTLVTPTLSTLSPPPLPPRSTPFLPGPPITRPSVQLPPLPPTSPTHSTVLEAHHDPLITPSTSPTPSVIQCPPLCDSVQDHPFLPSLLQPNAPQSPQLLGDKLVSKYHQKALPAWKHQIVSTSISSLGSTAADNIDREEVFDSPNISSGLVDATMSKDGSVDITEVMEQISRELKTKQLAVQDAIEELLEEDIDNTTVHNVERDLDRILEKRDEFRNKVREFLLDYGDHLDPPAQSTWKNAITTLNSEVKNNAKKIRAKAYAVLPPSQHMLSFPLPSL